MAFGGGGARGLAHVHVIKALEELGVKPDRISGTSIGSIMGAGLASGMTAAEVEDHVIGVFSKPTEVLARFWSMRPNSVSEILSRPRTLIGNVDAVKVMNAFLPQAVQVDFDDLQIPLQVVATDFYGQEEVVISDGPVTAAVGASSALPAIFRSVKRDGRMLVDGGLLNAVPYELLSEHVDCVVAVDVVGGPARSTEKEPSRIESLTGSSQLMMQATTRMKVRLNPPNVMIVPPVDSIRVLDFMKAKSIFDSTRPTVELAKREISAALEHCEKG